MELGAKMHEEHPTAIIEGKNEIGEGALIGPFVKVKDVKLGKNAKLFGYANAYGCEIGDESKIGAFTEIQSGVKIGRSTIVSSHSFLCSMVTVGDNVFIGHGVMTINDVYPPSYRRTGTNKHWEPTHIGNNAIIGTNATLFPVKIGDYAVIGAGSVVTKDVPAGQVWAGNPARYIKDSKDLKRKDGTYVYPELRKE